MTAELIDGKKVAKDITDSIKERVSQSETKPGLALVLVGDDPASHIYVGMKEKKCKECGFYVEKHILDEDTPEMNVLELVEKLNGKKEIHGILVQLPLPKHIDEQLIIDGIRPDKDVDGFTPVNLGFLMVGDTRFVAATSAGILELIKSVGEDITGKHAVVVGRSNVVGKPAALLLLEEHATVSLCHSRTKHLGSHTKQADILVVAAGKPNLVTGDMIKEGAIVIDAGTNKVGDKLVGDVEFESAKEVASHITPVPGGVGPMTIAMLLSNTLKAMEMQTK